MVAKASTLSRWLLAQVKMGGSAAVRGVANGVYLEATELAQVVAALMGRRWFALVVSDGIR